MPKSGFKFSIIWLSLAGLISAISLAASQETAQNQNPETQSITLTADANHHFRGTLQINHTAMPFLIDTGATLTTIPMKLAVAAGLPFGDSIEVTTAGGKAFAKTTLIKSLQLGPLEITNMPANLNQHLSEVLIGMNTLKFFQISQNADTLILSINQQQLGQQNSADAVNIRAINRQPKTTPQADSPAQPITKALVCDDHQHCIQHFSNQP